MCSKFRLLQLSTNWHYQITNVASANAKRQMFAWREGKTNPTGLERWLLARSTCTWQYRISFQHIKCSWPLQLIFEWMNGWRINKRMNEWMNVCMNMYVWNLQRWTSCSLEVEVVDWSMSRLRWISFDCFLLAGSGCDSIFNLLSVQTLFLFW